MATQRRIKHIPILDSLHIQNIPSDLEGLDTVEAGVTSTTITGLENGIPLLVSIIAVDDQERQSERETILRVIPGGDTEAVLPPRIVSEPDTDATAGFSHHYLPLRHEPITEAWAMLLGDATADDNMGMTGEEYSQIDIPIVWELERAPLGMDIDLESGFISWTPTDDQVGDATVTIRVSNMYSQKAAETRGGSATGTQEYVIGVLAHENASGLNANPYIFLTYPSDFTREK